MPRRSPTSLPLALAASVLAAATCLFGTADADEDAGLTRRARAVAELRAEVGQLEDELRTTRQTRRQELLALQSQKRQLTAQVDRAQARAESLEQMVADRRRELEARREAARARAPIVEEALEALEPAIAHSAPFRRKERLDQLAEIERQLQLDAAPPDQLLDQLWRLVEDELQLGLSSGLHKQVLELPDGTERLVEIARLGMALIYWRTEDGQLGMIARGPDGAWTPTPLEAPEDRAGVEELFEALRLQQRGRLHTLPMPPSRGARP